jgi:hypothetical protein
MANVEIKDINPFEILDDRYNSQVFVTDEVLKGLVIAPRLGFDTTEAKNVPWFTREKSSKQMFDENLMMEPLPAAQGAQILKVSGSELTPDNKVLRTISYAYEVDLADLEANPKPFMEDIKDMSYGIVKAIETNAGSAMIAAATESTATVTGGVWSANSRIAECLRSFKSEYMKRDINSANLNVLFEQADNYDELGNFIIATEGANNLVESDNVINYSAMEHVYTANGITEGKVLGWNSQINPADIIYRKIKDAYEPIEVKPGVEGYMPVINMKIIDSDGPGLDPVREFRFGASWTVAVNRKAGIFYKTGV